MNSLSNWFSDSQMHCFYLGRDMIPKYTLVKVIGSPRINKETVKVTLEVTILQYPNGSKASSKKKNIGEKLRVDISELSEPLPLTAPLDGKLIVGSNFSSYTPFWVKQTGRDKIELSTGLADLIGERQLDFFFDLNRLPRDYGSMVLYEKGVEKGLKPHISKMGDVALKCTIDGLLPIYAGLSEDLLQLLIDFVDLKFIPVFLGRLYKNSDGVGQNEFPLIPSFRNNPLGDLGKAFHIASLGVNLKDDKWLTKSSSINKAREKLTESDKNFLDQLVKFFKTLK